MKTAYKLFYLCIIICTHAVASAQVPLYNSYPSATAVIFLDFDGHLVEGTSWNGSGPIVCDSSNLSPQQITEVFNRVAEDYRPFAVNVTTDSAKYWAAPRTKRIRVVLTTSSSWFGLAGGVAYYGSFSWGDNTPCFVFTALHNYNTKKIAESASHEAGHTLGLRHQSSYDAVCNKISEYNTGTGSGEIGWAPIMGVGYYENLTLWHFGANPYGCTAYQDDLAILTDSTTGVSFRTDDYTNTVTTAAAVSLTNNAFSVEGVIETPNDTDAIKFVLPSSGKFKLDARPFSIAAGNVGANLDLELRLTDSYQNIVGVYNPATTLDASIDTMLNTGTYYLQVYSKGNIYAPNYASLGSYNLQAVFSANTPLPFRKLVLKGTTENGRHKLDWIIDADEKVSHQQLETSADGIHYQTLQGINPLQRSFIYSPAVNRLVYYRMKVIFDNGRQYYSNIVVLRNNGTNSKPYLIGNVITGSIIVSAPYTVEFIISDMTGKAVQKGHLAGGINTINTSAISNGLYIIQFDDGHETFTEKFLKK